jgi:hypothetical protein
VAAALVSFFVGQGTDAETDIVEGDPGLGAAQRGDEREAHRLAGERRQIGAAPVPNSPMGGIVGLGIDGLMSPFAGQLPGNAPVGFTGNCPWSDDPLGFL